MIGYDGRVKIKKKKMEGLAALKIDQIYSHGKYKLMIIDNFIGLFSSSLVLNVFLIL